MTVAAGFPALAHTNLFGLNFFLFLTGLGGRQQEPGEGDDNRSGKRAKSGSGAASDPAHDVEIYDRDGNEDRRLVSNTHPQAKYDNGPEVEIVRAVTADLRKH